MLLCGVIEYYIHIKQLKSIPIRIMVNGSRGKSSVTRLISSGLRGGGIKTIAKTTGTEAALIDFDGNDHEIHRINTPSIGEQIRIFKYFKRIRPQAIVIECMAIQPAFQWIMERQLVKSTIGVITNSRLDHVAEMGPKPDQISRSLANTIPQNAILFTADKKAVSIFSEIAEARNSKIVLSDENMVPDKVLENFPYMEHKENISLALEVCHHLGVDRESALKSMYKANPDPGALRRIVFHRNYIPIQFVNSFAANDPESTLKIWKMINKKNVEEFYILLNSRPDRIERSFQLLNIYIENMSNCNLLLVGSKTGMLLNKALQASIPKTQITCYEKVSAPELVEKILDKVTKSCLIYAIGNMGGGGSEIVDYIDELYQKELVEKND